MDTFILRTQTKRPEVFEERPSERAFVTNGMEFSPEIIGPFDTDAQALRYLKKATYAGQCPKSTNEYLIHAEPVCFTVTAETCD